MYSMNSLIKVIRVLKKFQLGGGDGKEGGGGWN